MFEEERPRVALSAKLAPSNWHQSQCDRWWVICNHIGKQFGGLYHEVEVDYILSHFAERSELIEPSDFGIVADRAIALFTQGRAAQ